MWDFICFRRMLVPIFIQILFWAAIFVGIYQAIFWGMEHHRVLMGGVLAILSIIAVRVLAEVVIVMFMINDTLTDINETLAAMSKHRLELTDEKDS